MLETENLDILADSVRRINEGFQELPAFTPEHDYERIRDVLMQAADRMQDNFPYAHPLYCGQMLKPPHPMARLAYSMAMYINPNNHALDGGRASSAMEKEAVASIAEMFSWKVHLGHLTSSGTMANLEALWIAGQIHPHKKIVASSQAHYTHNRISDVLKLEFESIAIDKQAKMDANALEQRLKLEDIGTVVVTLGTTGVGSVDPLPAILALRDKYDFRIHVDAAYGGYFTLVNNLAKDTQVAFDCLDQVDSIVIDPHKHGLQPYGCGCVLFRDPAVGKYYQHDSPYTYFSSDELHLGEISLECSRAGASAVALWATQTLLPMNKDGQFAADLAKSRDAALQLFQRISHDPRSLTMFPPELDIIIWAPRANTASEISKISQQHFARAAKSNLHLALVSLPEDLVAPYWKDVEFDQDSVTCLRSCLIKPEHLDWLDRIWEIMDKLAE